MGILGVDALHYLIYADECSLTTVGTLLRAFFARIKVDLKKKRIGAFIG